MEINGDFLAGVGGIYIVVIITTSFFFSFVYILIYFIEFEFFFFFPPFFFLFSPFVVNLLEVVWLEIYVFAFVKQ